jgi:dGTPase
VEWKNLLSPRRVSSKQLDSSSSRSAFEQDYDRIIFSHPFRRLQDKTQVHPLPEQDFVHTRLTHSLEVSSVGRSLGRMAGEVILQRHTELRKDYSLVDFGAIVAAAALAHDIGNPPFGHAGESAISDFFREHETGLQFKALVNAAEWEDLCKFEGNAQGFRLLNKNQFGLKLSAATLGAFTKYPCPALLKERDKSRRSQKKFGFFQSEASTFEVIAAELELQQNIGSWSRHPLAFLVEAADDICYSIIDLEDGCNLGLVNYAEAEALYAAVIGRSNSKLGKLRQLDTNEEKVSYLRALAIADLTAELSALFLDNESAILNSSFDTALADACKSASGLKDIIGISVEKIYRSRQVLEIEASGHIVLPGLLEEFIRAGEFVMSSSESRKYQNLSLLLPADVIRQIKSNPGNHYHMLRHVIDFISGLTDRRALSLYRKIKGIEY